MAASTTVKTTKVSQKFNTAEDVVDLVEAIQNAADILETLILEGNSYGIEPAQAIGEALQMCPRIRHLGFNDMFISRLKSEIPEALRLLFGGVMASGAQIETLNLNDNAIGPVTMPQLLPFLESTSCANLKILRLNNCGLGIKGGHMLSTVLPALEQLKELVIGRNRLEIDGVRDISTALLKLNKLEILELPQNGTKGEAIVALAGALSANRNLRVVNLNDNVLKGQDGLLADVLKQLTNLAVLNLGDCLLKTSGAISVMVALKELCDTAGVCHLREIILNGNEIGKGADEAIVGAIEAILASRISGSLKIDLSCNNLGEDLVERLRGQFENTIELIIDDDEGSADEAEEDAEEDEDEDTTRGPAGDDSVVEASPMKNGAVKDAEVLDLDALMAKYEAKFTTLPALASNFFYIASKGFQTKSGTLKEGCLVELEALIKVGQSRQSANQPLELVNALLVGCGLIKAEDKTLMPPKGADLTGGLLGLGMTLKFFTSTEAKKVLKSFLKKTIDEAGDGRYEMIKTSLFSCIFSF